MRPAITSLIAVPLALAALAVGPAWAQNNPSAEQIIQSLRPNGDQLKGETRGIRLANPASAGPSVSLDVEFATGSAELTPQARKALDQLGRALTSQDLAQYHFRIEGHTDTVGTPAANKALSQRRADAVAAYLERKFGVAGSRLQPVGMGEEGLAVPTPPQTPNAQNRRVRVVNQDAAG
jgi:OOP family OmpA-OmpF porin